MMDMNVMEALAAPGGDSMAAILAAREQAEIQAAVIMAARKPRDWDVTREKLLRECKRPKFAEVARYLKPIGEGVEGFSIRFAETAIQLATNIAMKAVTVYEDMERRKLRVSVWDLESQVSYALEITVDKTVERRNVSKEQTVLRTRKNSKGDLLHIVPATEDDLLNKQNALISKAIRTQGLRLIPANIKDECHEQILATLKERDAKDPYAAKQRIFDSFSDIGVPVADLKRYLGHEANQLTPKELADLRALYSAIRDGETSWKSVIDQMEADTRAKQTSAPVTSSSAVTTVPITTSGPVSSGPATEPTRGTQALRDAVQRAKDRDHADDEFYRRNPVKAQDPDPVRPEAETNAAVSVQESGPPQATGSAGDSAPEGMPLAFDVRLESQAEANRIIDTAAKGANDTERGRGRKR